MFGLSRFEEIALLDQALDMTWDELCFCEQHGALSEPEVEAVRFLKAHFEELKQRYFDLVGKQWEPES